MHTMTKRQGKSGTIDIKAVLAEDEEFLRALVRTALQEVLEAEMTEALGAEKGERAAGRQGYRSAFGWLMAPRLSANRWTRFSQSVKADSEAEIDAGFARWCNSTAAGGFVWRSPEWPRTLWRPEPQSSAAGSRSRRGASLT